MGNMRLPFLSLTARSHPGLQGCREQGQRLKHLPAMTDTPDPCFSRRHSQGHHLFSSVSLQMSLVANIFSLYDMQNSANFYIFMSHTEPKNASTVLEFPICTCDFQLNFKASYKSFCVFLFVCLFIPCG